MEAPVAMRESMTTTMPSPPDWRSVFLFSRAWRKKKEDEKVSAILRATTTTKNRNARERPVLRSNDSQNGKKKEPKPRGRRRLDIFSSIFLRSRISGGRTRGKKKETQKRVFERRTKNKSTHQRGGGVRELARDAKHFRFSFLCVCA